MFTAFVFMYRIKSIILKQHRADSLKIFPTADAPDEADHLWSLPD
jgi:hypothetical protein